MGAAALSHDVHIIDRMLSDGHDGLWRIRELRTVGSGAPILILSALAEIPMSGIIGDYDVPHA